MKRIFTILVLLSLFGWSNVLLKAQTTLTLQPNAATGKDALISSLYSTGNFGTHPDFNAEAWTVSGNFSICRSLIDFDLSSIPSTAVITGATLYLYTYNSSHTGQHSGNNMSYLQRITSNWNANTVTWNTAPATTTLHQDTLATSTNVNENYVVDVTILVQDYVNDQANSFGFMIRLADETIYKRMNFGSSDNADSTLHPKLVVTYTTSPLTSDTCITMQPDAKRGRDAMLHGTSGYMDNNYGTDQELPASAWTFSGVPGVIRSVIEFDLNTIPSNAIVTSAKLSLYAIDNNLSMGQHSTLSGSNDCLLQRITSTWDQSTVTWNTQPTTTTQNEVALAASDSATENYLDIDVTAVTKDMINNPLTSFGFMLKLQNESYYRRMNFCSSDHTNPALRPKLEVCYSIPNGVHELQLTNNYVSIYPNPVKDILTIETNSNTQQKVEILNLMEQSVYTSFINKKTTVNTSAFAKGVYILKLSTDKELLVRKFVKE